MVERRAGSLIEAALTGVAEMERIAEARRLIMANAGIFGLATGAAHESGGIATAFQCIAQLTRRDTPESSVLTLSLQVVTSD